MDFKRKKRYFGHAVWEERPPSGRRIDRIRRRRVPAAGIRRVESGPPIILDLRIVNPLILLLFCSLWFLNAAVRSIVAPLLPLMEDEFHLNHALAAGLSSFLSGGYTVMLLLSGWVAQRIGHKRAIAVGLALASGGLLACNLANGYLSLAILLLCMGLGTGVYKPNAISLITTAIPSRHWGRAIAAHDSASAFSLTILPVIAAAGLGVFAWRHLLSLLGVLCVIGFLAFSLYAPSPRSMEAGERAGFGAILRRKDFRVIVLLWIFATCCSMGLYSVIPLFLVKERGIPLELASTVFGLSRAGGIFVTLLAGFFADRFGTKRTLVFASLATGLSTIGLSLSRPFPLLVAMLFLEATISNLFFPVILLAISRLTTLEDRSLFIGAGMGTAGITGFCAMPIAMGAVADAWSFQLGIFLLGLLTTLSCLLFTYLEVPERPAEPL